MKPGGWYARWLKRPIDVVLAAVLLIVLAPVMATVAVAVWIVLGRPVLFVDRRAGRHGHPINVPKFRSMTNAFDATGQPLPDADHPPVEESKKKPGPYPLVPPWHSR